MYASFKEAEMWKLGQNLFLNTASTSNPMNNTDKWICKTMRANSNEHFVISWVYILTLLNFFLCLASCSLFWH